MNLTRTMVVGQQFRWDGDQWTIVALEDSLATIQSRSGRTMALQVREMARKLADDELLEPLEQPEGIGQLLGNLGVDERKSLQIRLRDVNEVLTGFRSGDPSAPAQDEPRPQYAPGQPMMSRYLAKAEERGVHQNTIRRWVSNYRKNGMTGLLLRLA